MNFRKSIRGFTLIELLIVIVIIGILATIATSTFRNSKSQAHTAKIQAQKIQASKERYLECIRFSTQGCGPSFILYADGGGVYKKDWLSQSSDSGIKILNISVRIAGISLDGQYFVYADFPNSFLWKKNLNDNDPNNLGIQLTQNLADTSAGSFDGKYVIYQTWTGLYKKDIASNDETDPGTLLLNTIWTESKTTTPDAHYLIYGAGGATYKRELSSTNASNLGTKILDIEGSYLLVTRDGKYLIYRNYDDNNVYIKDINNTNPLDTGTVFISETFSPMPLYMSPDGRDLIYHDFTNNTNYKKSLNNKNANDPGIIFNNNTRSRHIFP